MIPAQYRVIVTHQPRSPAGRARRSRNGWHVPPYRQAKMLAFQGIDLDRTTLPFWVGYAAAELTPPYERLEANLLASAKLAVDETPGAGARSRARSDEDRLLLGDCALGRNRYAGCRVEAASISRTWSRITASCSATAMPLTRSCPRTG